MVPRNRRTARAQQRATSGPAIDWTRVDSARSGEAAPCSRGVYRLACRVATCGDRVRRAGRPTFFWARGSRPRPTATALWRWRPGAHRDELAPVIARLGGWRGANRGAPPHHPRIPARPVRARAWRSGGHCHHGVSAGARYPGVAPPAAPSTGRSASTPRRRLRTGSPAVSMAACCINAAHEVIRRRLRTFRRWTASAINPAHGERSAAITGDFVLLGTESIRRSGR